MLKESKDPTYRMPAEWEKQKSTWIAWPHNQRDWPNKFEFIPFVFCEIISKISNYQKINICLLYTSPSPRDRTRSRMPSSA